MKKNSIHTLIITAFMILSSLACGLPTTEESNLHEDSSHTTWKYSTKTDELTGKDDEFAEIFSINEVDFSFPYDGVQKGFLQIIKKASGDKNIILRLEKAQFSCIIDCTVSIRFDDGAVSTYKATPPAGNTTNAIFISNEDSIILSLAQSKKMYISATFYREPKTVFEFTSEGFNTNFSE